MSLPITERQASQMTGTDLFYTVVRDSGGEYGDPYYVRLASLAAYLGYAESAGDVIGPDSSTINAVARFNGETGNYIKNSVVIIGNAGEVSGVKTFALSEYIDFTEMSTPSNPAANIARMYSKDDGGTTKMYFRDSTGTETELGGGGGAGDVTAAAVIADHTMVRGDGGAKGVQDTGITISDADVLVSPGSATFDDLYLYDTNASHTLLFHWNENEAAANRVLNFIMGGGDRTLTMTANASIPTLDGETVQIDAINSDGGAFPFDTTGTVTFNQTVVASNGAIQIGVNDTQMGWLTIYGNGGGSTLGGRIYLYTAADHDVVVNNYYVQVSSDLFQIGDNAGGVRFTLNTLGNITCVGSVTMDDLLLYDTNASHYLTFHWNEDEAGANRTLNWVMGGATRTITLSGSPTLGDWFDQAVKQASNVTFGTIGCTELTATGSIIATGGGQTGKFLTGSAGVTVFAFSGGNFDIRAGTGGASSQNVLSVDSSGNFDFSPATGTGNITTTGTLDCGVFTVTLPNTPIFTVTELDLTGSDAGDLGYAPLLTGTPTTLPSGLGIKDAIVLFGNTIADSDPKIIFATDTFDHFKALYYDLTADTFIFEDALKIEGTLDSGAITSGGNLNVTGTGYFTGSVTVRGPSLTVGISDTIRGTVYLYGPSAGDAGGQARFYLSDAHDATIAYYAIYANEDDLYIGPDTDPDFMKIVAGTSLEIDGNVGIGLAPATNYRITVLGDTGDVAAIRGEGKRVSAEQYGIYGIAQTANANDNKGVVGYSRNSGAGDAWGGYFDGNVHCLGCITDTTCELFDTVDALAVIKELYTMRTGMIDEFGHERYDMKVLHERHPFLANKVNHVDPETGEKSIIYGDRLGAKSDLLYRAVMQHQEKIEALEAELDRLRELVRIS